MFKIIFWISLSNSLFLHKVFQEHLTQEYSKSLFFFFLSATSLRFLLGGSGASSILYNILLCFL